MSIKRISLLICCILCLCLLTGCGSSESLSEALSFQGSEDKIPADSTDISLVLYDGETALLDELTLLEHADFSGSECVEEIYNWAQANPQVEVKYTVTMPDGTVLDNSTKSVDLSDASGDELRRWAECLRFLPDLKTLELGHERSGLSWDDIGALQQACPNAKLKYSFELYGKEFDIQNTQLNLSHLEVNDDCAALRKAMDHMPNLTYVDMDSCGIPSEEMAVLRDDYPDIKIVWRIWFGSEHIYSVRTDVEMILASRASVAGYIDDANGAELKYCTEVKYLDLGHNGLMRDISFVEYMPKLEVLIIAMSDCRDITPLASCPNLEYLEMQTTPCTDLSPLSGLKNLRHLNVACIPGLTDISPLYSLTELERLWLGNMNGVPDAQLEQMQKAAPNCEINTSVYSDPTSDGWRYGSDAAGNIISAPRYILLRLQFEDYKNSAFSFCWNDPLYY